MPDLPLRPPRAIAPIFLLLAALIGVAGPGFAPAARAAEFGDPGSRMRVYWLERKLVVGVYPRANEGYIQIARRVMAEPEGYPAIKAFNRNKPVRAGVQVNFPIATVKPALRGRALRAMYPEDELTEGGWSHHVTDPLENLIQLTEAYTGSKGRFKELARRNRLKNPDVLPRGTIIIIPLHWIPEALGFRPLAVKKPLNLDKDAKSGRIYASYAVRRNDTLYSILLRFTDQERAEELQRMAGLIVKINRLSGPTRLQAGRPLRLPVEWVSEDYLVYREGGKTPRRTATVRRQRPLETRPPAPQKQAPPQVRRPPLPPPKRGRGAGAFHVILDPGHGGHDPGAVYGRPGRKDHVYEHEVVHDIALRLAGLLRYKGIRVYSTIEDPGRAGPVERLTTMALGGERVRVSPPYKMRSSKVAVNMRVYFINALYRRLLRAGVSPDNVALVSLHGDALAPTLRGAMVYYPDHRLRVDRFQPRGRVYRLRREAVPGRLFFRTAETREAELLSRDFGEQIIASFKAHRLGAAHRRAVRPYYYRKGERTLPGVLRYSKVPTSVLVEVANLNNRAERLAVLKGAHRQRIARALADAVRRLRAERRAPLIVKKSS